MSFIKKLPEWNKAGVEPPKSKKDAGWQVDERPPADYMNWLQKQTFDALKELQEGAAHKEELAATNEQLADIVYIVRPSGGDDTTNINNAITNVSTSPRLKKVVLDGNFNVSVTQPFGHAVIMKSNVILEFTPGSKLNLAPNNYDGYDMILCNKISNFKIINPYVIGDRDKHIGTTGEWGHGINILGCSNFELVGDIIVEKCWGDGIAIDNADDSSVPTNVHIDRIKVLNCRRNGTSIQSANNLRVESIEGSNINGVAPFASLDIEANGSSKVWKNIRIGKVKSSLCKGGVMIQPLSMLGYPSLSTIDISIDDVEIIGNDTSDTGTLHIDGIDETKVTGNIRIKRVTINKTDRGLSIYNVLNGGIKVDIDFLDVTTETTNDSIGFASQCGIYIENNIKLTTKNIGDININQVRFSGNAPYFASIITQNSGTYERTGLRIGRLINKVTKPMYINKRVYGLNPNPTNMEVNILDIPLIYNVGQTWFSTQFLSTLYHNEGATSDKTISMSGNTFCLQETPITIENRVNGFYLKVDLTGMVIYPASLGFINGFKSNTIGSRIKFMQMYDGTYRVLEMIGSWVTF